MNTLVFIYACGCIHELALQGSVMGRIAQNWGAVLLDSTALHFGTGFWNEGDRGDTPLAPCIHSHSHAIASLMKQFLKRVVFFG